jgi:ribonuclease HI
VIVTIFTDASFDPHTHASGWSAWIKFGPAPDQTRRYFGPVKVHCPDIHAAELAAIANAVFLASRGLKLSAADLVIVQSDSQTAIDLANGQPNSLHRRKSIRRMVDTIRNTVTSGGFRLELRHVKGHRGTEDRRAAVNSWCDRTAREAMRQQRDEKRKAKA